MKIPPAVAAVPFLVVLLTWLMLGAFSPDSERFGVALAKVDLLAGREARLQADVLRARVGVLRNYDTLVQDS